MTEQTVKTAAVDHTEPKSNEPKQGKKSMNVAIVPKFTEGEAVPEELTKPFVIDLSNFTKSISRLCASILFPFTFTFLNRVVKVGKYNQAAGNGKRTFDIFRQVAAIIFETAEPETVVKIEAGSNTEAILTSLYKAGFKYTSVTDGKNLCSRYALLKAINIKDGVRKESMKAITNDVNKAMIKEVAIWKELKEHNKAQRVLIEDRVKNLRLNFAKTLLPDSETAE